MNSWQTVNEQSQLRGKGSPSRLQETEQSDGSLEEAKNTAPLGWERDLWEYREQGLKTDHTEEKLSTPAEQYMITT